MRRRRMLAEINVVPYIDVMLVLLVIFMVTAPMLMQGVEVDLPDADAAPVEDQDAEPLIVSINDRGQLFLNLGADEQQPLEDEASEWEEEEEDFDEGEDLDEEESEEEDEEEDTED